MPNKELKPCPFCKSKIEMVIGFQGIIFFKCQNREDCGAIVSFDNRNFYKQKPIEVWNRRADNDFN